ncbi:hypothetical protein ACEN88_27545, partial [Massilia sp. CT11-108]
MLIADRLIERCAGIVGAANVLVDEHDTAPYLTDWRGRFTGRALCLLNNSEPTRRSDKGVCGVGGEKKEGGGG